MARPLRSGLLASRRGRLLRCVAFAALGIAGCTGSIGERSGDGEPAPAAGVIPPRAGGPAPSPASPPTVDPTTPPPGPTVMDPSCPPKGPAVGPRARRIGPTEYVNTVKALLHGRGADGPLPTGWTVPLDALSDGLDRYARVASTTSISGTNFTDLLDSGKTVAAAYVAKLEAAPDSCLKSGPFPECARKTVRAAGEILFRRPLDPEQEQAYAALAEGALAEKGANGALALAVNAMLASPDMVFHLEFGRARGTGGAPASLDGYEMASAISSLLAAGPPDEALWQSAKAGQLATADQIRPHVVRLLGDLSLAPAPLVQFVQELFGYEHVVDVFKDEKFHSPEGLITDTNTLLAHLVAKNGRAGFFEALLTTPAAFASAATDQSYGLPAQAITSKQREPIQTMGLRAGLLTQPSFLAANSENKETAPVKRGIFVRQELLCQPVPALPIGLVPVLPDEPMTAREKLAIHTEKVECQGCHKLMDPFGLAFEIYDHLGRHRTIDHGKPIDATGMLDGSGDQDGPFRDALELIAKLGRSQAVTQCLSRQLFRFVAARNDQPADDCAVSRVTDAYTRSGGDVVEAIVAAFAAETFRTRRLP